jgi:hypothetical protein
MLPLQKNKIMKLTRIINYELQIKKLFIRLFAYSLIYLFTFSSVSAQTTDSTEVIQNENLLSIDTDNNILIDTNKSKTKVHSPKKAAWMSAAVPGLGQIYNKKYWYIKIPVIYGGFVGLSYGININYIHYARFRDEYRNRLKGKTELCNPEWAGYQDANINAMRQEYQRKMETFIIVSAVWYLVNILDAVVYAHLLHFDVSDDLSLNIMPSVGLHNTTLASNKLTPTTNITFIFKLK